MNHDTDPSLGIEIGVLVSVAFWVVVLRWVFG